MSGATIAIICVAAAALLAAVCIVIFAVARKKPKRLCATCGAELLESWTECPHCAKKQAEAQAQQAAQQAQEQAQQQKAQPPAPPKIQPVTIKSEGASGGSKPTVAGPSVQPAEQPATGAKGTVKLRTPKEKPVLAYLIVKEGQRVGHSFQLSGEVTTIGRDSTNNIVISDDAASGNHAKILVEEGKFFIHDLASSNGTFVNGEEVVRQEIFDGNEILFGETKLVFKTA